MLFSLNGPSAFLSVPFRPNALNANSAWTAPGEQPCSQPLGGKTGKRSWIFTPALKRVHDTLLRVFLPAEFAV